MFITHADRVCMGRGQTIGAKMKGGQKAMPGLGFEPRSLQSTILPFQTRPAGPYRLVSDAVLTYYTTRALLNLSGLIYIYRERESEG